MAEVSVRQFKELRERTGAGIMDCRSALAEARGDMEKAQQELKTYQTLKTNQETSLEAGVALAQGDKAMEAGHLDEAIIHYRQAVQTMPDTAYYHYKLSLALHKSGDAAGEKKELEETIRLDPKLSAAQGQLGYLLSREGDSE